MIGYYISLALFDMSLLIIICQYIRMSKKCSNLENRISFLEDYVKYLSSSLTDYELKVIDYKHDCSICTTRTLNIINSRFKELEDMINSKTEM